jgi:hypothetical protein
MESKERVKCSQLGCTKEIYNTGEEALNEIERILTTQRKITDKKPCRTYRCECGYYALTSKPKITEY